MGIVIYGPLKIVLLIIIILLVIGVVRYNMKYIKGKRSFSINYKGDYYLYSSLRYKEDEIDVIIDTGAQKTILNKQVLATVPHRLYKRMNVTINQPYSIAKGQMVKIKKIGFGDCELNNFSFVITSDIFNSLPELQEMEGAIGIDILRYFDLYFNANEYVLRLEKPVRNEEDPEIWGSTKLIVKNNFWGMYVNIDGKEFLAIIDTGVPSFLVIPASLKKDIRWDEPTEKELSFFDFWDDGNDKGLVRIIVKELNIFDEEILNLPAVLDPGTNHILIGLDFLSEFDLIISFKRERIYFKR